MPQIIDMIMDFQFGSTGKGLIAGYLAARHDYDTAVCAFSTNAGHTYVAPENKFTVMTQQLPTSIISPMIRTVLIGPGSAIHIETLGAELSRYEDFLFNKRILIHPHAAIVNERHVERERKLASTVGSTGKGVGAAYAERIMRSTTYANVANNYQALFKEYAAASKINIKVCTLQEYDFMIRDSQFMIVEGAQGFSLSMYHGAYPYTTSRDVTPWQIAADCGLPFDHASRINVIGTLRTYPIRVNNRGASSGPPYDDQHEITWDMIGVEPELTTVTKLPRRIFTFSDEQLVHAMHHCGHYWETRLFLNFANYCSSHEHLRFLVSGIEAKRPELPNPPVVSWVGFGKSDDDVKTRQQCVEQGILPEARHRVE